jgi:hypothetical protein
MEFSHAFYSSIALYKKREREREEEEEEDTGQREKRFFSPFIF